MFKSREVQKRYSISIRSFNDIFQCGLSPASKIVIIFTLIISVILILIIIIACTKIELERNRNKMSDEITSNEKTNIETIKFEKIKS